MESLRKVGVNVKQMTRAAGTPSISYGLDIMGLSDSALLDARRVILKRPPDAEITFGEIGKPTFTIETKLLRWEVWERG